MRMSIAFCFEILLGWMAVGHLLNGHEGELRSVEMIETHQANENVLYKKKQVNSGIGISSLNSTTN